MPNAADAAALLDELLSTRGFPDYPGALNGLQLDTRGVVTRVASAVDFSTRTVEATVAANANLLIVHHGMFWGGAQRIVGSVYEQLHRLISHNVAVYSAHLPLDAHSDVGNNALLAKALGLTATERFGEYEGVSIGVAGRCDLATEELLIRATEFAKSCGGSARASLFPTARRTRRWAILTGAGGGSREIALAQARDIDTLIVGEGPHHVTVNAPDANVVVIFAGHYATETLGVRALGEHLSRTLGIPHDFLYLPTGS